MQTAYKQTPDHHAHRIINGTEGSAIHQRACITNLWMATSEVIKPSTPIDPKISIGAAMSQDSGNVRVGPKAAIQLQR